ncbi:MAG TPA: ROK family protein, partial [Acidimicrobiales bacterium]|nr:ROK family protein [Acidimicrobiales bacterium]
DGDPVDGVPVGGGRVAGGADPAAIATRDEAVEALAGVLTGIQRLLDLDLVVIGGGLAAAGDALVGPLATELARRAAFQHPPRVRVGSLGPDAGAYGAAVLAWEAVAGLDAVETVGLPRPALDSSPAD